MAKEVWQTTKKFRDGAINPYPTTKSDKSNTADFMFRVLCHYGASRINIRMNDLARHVPDSKLRTKLLKQLETDGFVIQISSK